MKKGIILSFFTLFIILSAIAQDPFTMYENAENKITIYGTSGGLGFTDFLNDPTEMIDLLDDNVDIIYIDLDFDDWTELDENDELVYYSAIEHIGELNQFMWYAQQNNILVYAMIASNGSYCLEQNHPKVMARLDAVFGWNNSKMPNHGLFYGIVLDIEPAGYDDWDEITGYSWDDANGDWGPGANVIMAEYFPLITQISQTVFQNPVVGPLPLIVYSPMTFQREYVDKPIMFSNLNYLKLIDAGATSVSVMSYRSGKENCGEEDDKSRLEIESHPNQCSQYDKYGPEWFNCAGLNILGEYDANNQFVPSYGADMEIAIRVWEGVESGNFNRYYCDMTELDVFKYNVSNQVNMNSSDFYGFAYESFNTYVPFTQNHPSKTFEKSSIVQEMPDQIKAVNEKYIIYNTLGQKVLVTDNISNVKENLKSGIYIVKALSNQVIKDTYKIRI